MRTLDQALLQILSDAASGLSASDIAERLNNELRPDVAHSTVGVAQHLKALSDQVVQLPDGKWMLKRLML